MYDVMFFELLSGIMNRISLCWKTDKNYIVYSIESSVIKQIIIRLFL